MKSETMILNNKNNVTLTTYLLDSSNEFGNITTRPAVLVLPGGGYMMCSDREAEPIAMSYAAEGYNAFVLRYSVAEHAQWPNPLEDAEAALELIRLKGSEWGIDTEKIAVIGFSAGGHLAAALSTIGRVKPNAMILGYPCILEEISNILATRVPGLDDKVDSETPPAFLFTTRDDNVVPARNTIRFLDALDKADVPYEAHIFYSGMHGMSLAKSHTSSGYRGNVSTNNGKWFEQSMTWLKQVFGDFKTDSIDIDMKVENDSLIYGIDNAIKELLNNSACREILVSKIPVFANGELMISKLNISLRKMSQYAKGVVTPELLDEIEAELNKVRR